MKKTIYSAAFSLALAMTCVSAPAFAKETPKPIQQHNSNAVWFENWIGLTNTSFVIASPNGEVTTIFAKSGTPVFQLSGNEIQDGVYRYELKAATEETRKMINKVDNGRGDAARDEGSVPFYSSGSFVVSRGVIIAPKDLKEE